MDEETGCLMPGREWIQCSYEKYGVWSHVECLKEAAVGFSCLVLSECVFQKKNWKLKSYPKTVCCSFNFMSMPIFLARSSLFSLH